MMMITDDDNNNNGNKYEPPTEFPSGYTATIVKSSKRISLNMWSGHPQPGKGHVTTIPQRTVADAERINPSASYAKPW